MRDSGKGSSIVQLPHELSIMLRNCVLPAFQTDRQEPCPIGILVSSLSEVLSCMHLSCQLRAADSADRALLLAQVQFYSLEKYSVSTNSVPGLGVKELTFIGINTYIEGCYIMHFTQFLGYSKPSKNGGSLHTLSHLLLKTI